MSCPFEHQDQQDKRAQLQSNVTSPNAVIPACSGTSGLLRSPHLHGKHGRGDGAQAAGLQQILLAEADLLGQREALRKGRHHCAHDLYMCNTVTSSWSRVSCTFSSADLVAALGFAHKCMSAWRV